MARSKAAVRPASPAPTIGDALGLARSSAPCGEAWRRPSSTQARSRSAMRIAPPASGAAAVGLARMIANVAEDGGKGNEAGVDGEGGDEIAGLHLRRACPDVEMQRARRRARRRLLLDAAGFPRFDALTVHGLELSGEGRRGLDPPLLPRLRSEPPSHKVSGGSSLRFRRRQTCSACLGAWRAFLASSSSLMTSASAGTRKMRTPQAL